MLFFGFFWSLFLWWVVGVLFSGCLGCWGCGVLGVVPGGVRTDRISCRDLEVLGFIARYGVVSRRAVAVWAGTGRTVTIVREGRLVRSGLVEAQPGFGGLGVVLAVTAEGLRALGLDDLRVPRFSFGSLVHDCVVAEAGARLESSGWSTFSEREVLSLERAERRVLYCAELSRGRVHRPDLVRCREGSDVESVEVELAVKGAARLDELLRGWRRAVGDGRLSGVVYWCSPRVLSVVDRAVRRTRTDRFIRVEALPSWCLLA